MASLVYEREIGGGVIKTTRPWVSKMADRRYHVASISRQFRGPIYWNAHASSSFDHAHWGYNSVFKQIRRCSVDGRKRYENDKCGRKSSWKRSKTAPFSFENGLVWTGPKYIGIKHSFKDVCLVFQRPFACMNDESKQICARANKLFCKYFLGSMDWTYI